MSGHHPGPAGAQPKGHAPSACCGGRHQSQPQPHSHSHAAAPAGAAIDPVCGMSVDPHTARHTAFHAGRPYYFCSAGCRERFLADPERYAAAGGAA